MYQHSLRPEKASTSYGPACPECLAEFHPCYCFFSQSQLFWDLEAQPLVMTSVLLSTIAAFLCRRSALADCALAELTMTTTN
jgi:hypothetical protein